MKPRHHANRFLEALAIPHLPLILVFGQALVFIFSMSRPDVAQAVPLLPALVLEGEWWRLFSFVLQPVSNNLFLNFISWMMLYFIGSALEAQWGAAKFTHYLLLGWILTTIVAFLVPTQLATNAFFVHSVFFAFAFLAPDFEMMVMFILPVKAKWLALILWLTYALKFIEGPMGYRLSILAAVGNFLIFFRRDLIEAMRGRSRRIVHAQRMREDTPEGPRHTCLVCGKNSDTHPDLDFRYCSKCSGDQCYCPEHIRNHEHVTEDKPVER